jgi:hypothetical protein
MHCWEKDMRTATLLACLVIISSLGGCQKQDTSTVWGDESESPEGEVIRYVVHCRELNGQPVGLPATVILLRYQRDGADTPKFAWECIPTDEVERKFRVGDKVVNEVKGTNLFINASDGSLGEIEVPWQRLNELFQRNARPSRDQLIQFWDSYVQRELRRSEQQ